MTTYRFLIQPGRINAGRVLTVRSDRDHIAHLPSGIISVTGRLPGRHSPWTGTFGADVVPADKATEDALAELGLDLDQHVDALRAHSAAQAERRAEHARHRAAFHAQLRLYEAAPAMRAALRALTLTPAFRAYLEANDRQVLRQALDALEAAA